MAGKKNLALEVNKPGYSPRSTTGFLGEQLSALSLHFLTGISKWAKSIISKMVSASMILCIFVFLLTFDTTVLMGQEAENE